MKRATINVNGEIYASNDIIDRAKICVYDRGFMYGDSLYEVMRTYDQKLFQVDLHMKRLEKSAELSRMKLGQSIEHYVSEMKRPHQEFLKNSENENTEAYCRLIITRGIGSIGFGLKCLESKTQYVIMVRPYSQPDDEKYAKGMRLMISSRLRNDRRLLKDLAPYQFY